MKKYTIEDLAAGKVATFIKDKSEIPDLERVLKLTFPKDGFDDYNKYLNFSVNEYYFANKYADIFWSSFRETDLPTQHVKDFLTNLEEEWEPKPGEICLVKVYRIWEKMEFLMQVEKLIDDEENYLFYDSDYTDLVFVSREQIKPLPQKIKLTIQEIADKFGIEVDRLEVVND